MQDITKRSGIIKGIKSQFNSPFYLLLFPFFYIMHKVNEVFGLIPFKYAAVSLAYCIALTLLLFIVGKILYKDKLKTYCWTVMLLILFFFFGAFHDFLKSISLPHFFVSYKFLLPVILLYILTFSYIIYRKNNSLIRTTSFLSIFFIIISLLELVVYSYKKITNEAVKNDLAYTNSTVITDLSAIMPESKPDIFFIVFDEYASSYSLNKYLGFKNNIDSLLTGKNFFVAGRSKSNYNSTPFSIGSTFDLDYFNLSLEDEYTIPKMMLKAEYSCKVSLLPNLLKKSGYTIINRSLYNIADHSLLNKDDYRSEPFEIFFTETFWGRIKKEIWWNTGIRLPRLLIDNNRSQVDLNRYNYGEVLKELKIQGKQPKFVYAHMLIPHRDYRFTRTGKIRDITQNDLKPGIRDSLYLDQLIYTNTWIANLAHAADSSFPRPRIIIIEGDHGYRRYSWEKPALPEKEFMNLNAFYFSDKNYSLLYDSISPVNSFRIVLNKYFNTNLPLLKDSTIFLY